MSANGYIFLSYAHKNHEQVKPVINSLKREGYDVWYDTHLELGEQYNQTIGEKIRDCTAFMCFLTKEYGASFYCKKEIGLAIEQYHKETIPVYMDNASLPANILLLLQGTNAVYLRNVPDALEFLHKIQATQVLARCRKETGKGYVDPNATMRNAKVNDIVSFGNYWQDFDYKTPIEWIVLEKKEKELLLLSRYVLDVKPYNATLKDITWAECTLREWLNEEFYKEAFSEEERRRIPKRPVPAHKNPYYDTNPGIRVVERMFLLSVVEAMRYLPNEQARMCAPTPFALEKNVWYNEELGTSGWWLRSPGGIGYYAAVVDCDGDFDAIGRGVVNFIVGVRPALWLILNP